VEIKTSSDKEWRVAWCKLTQTCGSFNPYTKPKSLMKLSFLNTSLMLIAASFGLSSNASAASYLAGDIFLGFRIDGGTQDYLINIGQASLYKSPSASSFTVPVGNIGADLSTVFGANWHTNAAVHWAVMGTNTNGTSTVAGDPGRTLYASKAEQTFGVQEMAWNRGSSTTQSAPAGKLMGMSATFATGTVTGNSSVAVIQDASVNGSYASYQPGGIAANSGGISFSYWNPSNEGDFGAGAGLAALDLFRMQTGSSSLSGDYLGTFTVTNGGVLTFNTSPVPEPASLTLISALGLMATRRRRSTPVPTVSQ